MTFGIAGSIDHEAAWLLHHRIVVERFGPWLTDQELRWSWRYKDGLWEAGFLRRPNDTPPV
ncbi:hypothetical protein DL991_40845 [Amycolatopsis sp. WAC 01375]|nr:hypothetical protein DL991_40845 [Amycolatopsis sp. WAC 01375]